MKKIRLAIADDHNIVRKGIVSILDSDPDFEVVADAPNGQELIRIIGSLKEPVDVCLLDINMPVMNGYDTLIALKKLYPDTHFMILTQLEHEFIIIKMLKAGASGYMLKDTEPAELKDAIHKIMAQPFYNNRLVNGHLISLVTHHKEYTKLTLTDREQEFLKNCCSEMTYKEIADRMNITERTVAFYRQSLFEKLHVVSRTGLALFALKLGLVPMDEMG